MKNKIINYFFKYIWFFTIILFFNCSSNVITSQINGRVTKIIDGDTLQILSDKNKVLYKIRIADIDAPEIDQDFGLKSKNFIYNKIYNKYVTVKKQNKDKYGRIVAHVLYNNKKNNIAEELLKNGLAWVWHYSHNKNYKVIELNAKNNKLGLWKYKNHIDPFLWRKKKNK